LKIINQILAVLVLLLVPILSVQASEISYQGRISKNGQEGGLFTGVNGYFKFAIVDSTGKESFWSNDSSSIDGGEPNEYVEVPFPGKNGVFQVGLGASPMSPLGSSVFKSAETYLRIWFSPDGDKFDLLTPDEKISTVAYSFKSKVAETVVDGSLGFNKLSGDFSGMTVVSSNVNDQKLNEMGFVRFGKVSAPPWVSANEDGQPSPLVQHTSVAIPSSKEGIYMIIWGGSPAKGFYSDSGWVYDSIADSWLPISPVDAPSKRIGHAAVVNGDNMMIWGGVGSNGQHLNDGGIYSLSQNKWKRVFPDKKIITARKDHTASIISQKMIVWGGGNEFDLIGDGVSYDFQNGKWKTIAGQGFPVPRKGHTATVYEDRLLFVWGGQSREGALSDGAVYNPEKEIWANLVADNSGPSARAGHTALMVNHRLVIWGGKGNNEATGDGFMFVIDRDTTDFEKSGQEVKGEWVKLSASGAPSARFDHSVEWTGTEMLIFGGETILGVSNTGFAYDILKDSWRSLTTKGGVTARTKHTSEWTGSQLVIFGGLTNKSLTGTGMKIRISETQLLDTQKTWHLYRKL
jgi:N-acetylneuraminic acid mutarotase